MTERASNEGPSERTAHSEYTDRDGQEQSISKRLGGRPDDATADVIEPYPREKYDAAMEGRIPIEDCVDDLMRHAEAQLPARVRSRRRLAA
jgi:hypothetical protein